MGFDKAFDAILSQGGIWAALFLLAVAALGLVARNLQQRIESGQAELQKCWQDRAQDIKAQGEVIQANTVVLAAQTAESAARTRAAEQMGRAQELSAVRIEALVQEVSRLKDEVGSTKTLKEDVLRLMREELPRLLQNGGTRQ